MSAAGPLVAGLAGVVLAVEYALARWRARWPDPERNAGRPVFDPAEELDADEAELPYKPPHADPP